MSQVVNIATALENWPFFISAPTLTNSSTLLPNHNQRKTLKSNHTKQNGNLTTLLPYRRRYLKPCKAPQPPAPSSDLPFFYLSLSLSLFDGLHGCCRRLEERTTVAVGGSFAVVLPRRRWSERFVQFLDEQLIR